MPSYKRCASIIVFFTVKRSRRAASRSHLLVVYGGTGFLFFRDNRLHEEIGILDRVENVLGFFLILDVRILAFNFDETRVELRRLVPFKFRDDGPVLLRHESLNLALTFHDQTQRDGLHAARGNSAAHFVPKKRADLVTDQSI